MGKCFSRNAPRSSAHNYQATSGTAGSGQATNAFSSAISGQEADLPPIRPPSKSKAGIIPSTACYQGIQNRVKHVTCYGGRVESLATALTRECPDDLHKVRAFFCWIAANLTYDVEALQRRHDVKSQEPETVLRTRRAVCQGYSQLFCALCRHAQIPCLMVTGLDKGMNYDPETVFTSETSANHAWNIVFVKGEWRPLDVTWGSGFMNDSRRFQRELTEHWFLTDPAEFVTDHFPLKDGSSVSDSEKYQLLKRPSTLEHFSAVVRLKALAFDLGVRGLSHKQAIIRVRRDVTITFRGRLETVRVTLTDRRRPGSSSCANILTSLDVDGTCKIYVRPPRQGKYLLDVKAKGENQGENHVSSLLSYLIECTTDHPESEPFPNKEEPWGLQRPQATQSGLKAQKNKPFSFEANRQGEVTVIVPLATPSATSSVPKTTTGRQQRNGTTAVSIGRERNGAAAGHITTVLKAELSHATQRAADLAQNTMVEYTQSSAVISARLPMPGYYLLRVYAGPPTSPLPHCADFLLHSTGTLTPTTCPPFPQQFTFAREHHVRLLSPRGAHVPAGQGSLFKIRAPGLGKVMVDKVEMVKGRGGVWAGEATPAAGGAGKVVVYGAVDPAARSLQGVFEFRVRCGGEDGGEGWR